MNRATRDNYVWPLALTVAYAVHAWVSSRHLLNNLWSDLDLTAWDAAAAKGLGADAGRLATSGLPISPGGIQLMLWVQRLTGSSRAIYEVWVCDVARWCMAACGYTVARAFAGPKAALFVASCVVAQQTLSLRDVGHESIAHAFIWGSMTLVTHALLRPRARTLCALGSGVLAGLSLAFDAKIGSSGACAVFAAVGVNWMACARHWRKQGATSPSIPDAPQLLALDTGAAANRARGSTDAGLLLVGFAAGAAAGLLITMTIVAALSHGSVSLWSDLLRGPWIAGGGTARSWNALLHAAVFRPSLAVVLLTGAALPALLRGGPSRMGHHPEGDSLVHPTPLAFIGALGIATASLLLCVPIPRWVGLAADQSIGLLTMGVGWFLLQVGIGIKRPSGDRVASPEERATLLMVVASCCAFLFRFAWAPATGMPLDMDLMVLPAGCALLRTLASMSPRAEIAASLVMALGIFGPRTQRASLATHRAPPQSFWGGMLVDEGGEQILRAVERVQLLTAPEEEVLVVPEDLGLAALTDRPRPALCGGFTFLDAYPAACVSLDVRALGRRPPKVILNHPAESAMWKAAYAPYGSRLPAAYAHQFVIEGLLPKRYRLDSSYPTHVWGMPAQLDVYVRKSPDRPASL